MSNRKVHGRNHHTNKMRCGLLPKIELPLVTTKGSKSKLLGIGPASIPPIHHHSIYTDPRLEKPQPAEISKPCPSTGYKAGKFTSNRYLRSEKAASHQRRNNSKVVLPSISKDSGSVQPTTLAEYVASWQPTNALFPKLRANYHVPNDNLDSNKRLYQSRYARATRGTHLPPITNSKQDDDELNIGSITSRDLSKQNVVKVACYSGRPNADCIDRDNISIEGRQVNSTMIHDDDLFYPCTQEDLVQQYRREVCPTRHNSSLVSPFKLRSLDPERETMLVSQFKCSRFSPVTFAGKREQLSSDLPPIQQEQKKSKMKVHVHLPMVVGTSTWNENDTLYDVTSRAKADLRRNVSKEDNSTSEDEETDNKTVEQPTTEDGSFGKISDWLTIL